MCVLVATFPFLKNKNNFSFSHKRLSNTNQLTNRFKSVKIQMVTVAHRQSAKWSKSEFRERKKGWKNKFYAHLRRDIIKRGCLVYLAVSGISGPVYFNSFSQSLHFFLFSTSCYWVFSIVWCLEARKTIIIGFQNLNNNPKVNFTYSMP